MSKEKEKERLYIDRNDHGVVTYVHKQEVDMRECDYDAWKTCNDELYDVDERTEEEKEQAEWDKGEYMAECADDDC
tara:strand:+ start:602 stop:829 length:228 start_codon:yes stop_codon:yes gene_type:complete